ncbi:riboflavin synthase, beta subunit [Anaplasma marginale str. St. Maries]|uniref:6,7-dimethyl-8-ribityllumazine synthase n=1 Tax=Anaplasma marginale (strain Florida) TaxID=320483 RepID=B9KI95_ANAMF|nr:riboflavin synthase, beta subunit [Anaplasma marginale str. St. Maries]ACM49207.1 riboflavin synthase, beta subunit [Anaplasma marginale str. Florida]
MCAVLFSIEEISSTIPREEEYLVHMGVGMQNSLNVLIVIGDFYPEISKLMIAGAVAKLQSYGAASVEHEVITVPGSFEVPAAISFAIMSDRERHDGYIALGCIVKGATNHHNVISSSVSASLGDIAVQHVVPLGFGIITSDSMELALERADPNGKDVGGNAATAVLRMIELYKRFLG